MGWIDVPAENDRRDLEALVRRLTAMDEASAMRIVAAGGALRIWARTPFGPLATRVVVGTADAADQVVVAGVLSQSISASDGGRRIDLGFPNPSAWQGMLPPSGGFEAVEMIGAQEILDLAEKGRGVAADESGPLGIAPSLLEQEVIAVGGEDASRLGVEMRLIFALTGLGFVPSRGGTAPAGERVRVASRGPWIRLDARYGSVFHRPESLPLDVV
ncbi:hypothetical protein [Dietzia sp.]|uniref:hypothetical protein n=1 Tax=Dietzia sp. TaxID=1871616 RepID=UPI002FD993F8